jgi:hypothetical protein
VSLTPSQKAFATSRAPFPAFVGGYGSGKSAAAIARAMALKMHFKQCDVAYYLPTYPLVEDIAYRRFPELCERKGWPYKLNKASAFIEFPGAGRIVFRTMEQPHRIVGYEVAHSILDELDTLPTEKAREVWNRVIARNRQKMPGDFPNTVGVATTPEGFRFVYERWHKNPAEGYVLFRAKTIENAANLPPGYIENLRNSYPEQLLSAYLDGEFVNLASHSVYSEFDRALNSSTETIKPYEPLHIGLDFNVGNVSAAVGVFRGDTLHIIEELTGVRDTPSLCMMLKDKYKAAGHAVHIYPDASGGATKSVNAALSDIVLLRAAGFQVWANSRNPAVRDRVASVNMLIHANGKRRLFIRPDTCPSMIEGLEQQAYDKHGDPDKSSGLDHLNDALGYLVAYKFPVHRGPTSLVKVSGV